MSGMHAGIYMQFNVVCAGMQLSAAQFFTYWLFITLVNLTAVGLAFMVGAAVTGVALANLLIIIPYVISAVF